MADEERVLVRLRTRITAQREAVMTARDLLDAWAGDATAGAATVQRSRRRRTHRFAVHPAEPGAPAVIPTSRRLRGPPVPVGISG